MLTLAIASSVLFVAPQCKGGHSCEWVLAKFTNKFQKRCENNSFSLTGVNPLNTLRMYFYVLVKKKKKISALSVENINCFCSQSVGGSLWVVQSVGGEWN